MATYSLGSNYFNSTVSNEPYISRTLTDCSSTEFNSTVSNISYYYRGTLVLKIPGNAGISIPTSGQIYPSGFQ